MPTPDDPTPADGTARHDRKAKRLTVTIASRIRYGGMQLVDVIIRDLAFTGFRADCPLELATNSRISIDLPPFGLVPARVAWCRDGRIGGLFDAAVDIRHCVLRPDEKSYFTAQRLRTSRSGDRLD